MPRTFTYVLALLILSFAWACEKPRLPFEEPEPELVVISEFTSNRSLQVVVSRSKSVFSNFRDTVYVLDAVVDLYRDGQFLERLQLDTLAYPPLYQSNNLRPEPNIQYTIRVSAPGFKPVTAHSRIPARIGIDAISVQGVSRKPGPALDELTVNYQVRVRFADPPEELNYYHLNFTQQINSIRWKDGEPSPRILRREIPVFDLAPAGRFIPEPGGGLLFTDDLFNGSVFSEEFSLRFQLRDNESLGQLVVELRAVSEDYFLYRKTLSEQQLGPGLPIQGDTPLYDNIDNGRGIFAGYNYAVDSVLVIQ